MTAVTGELRREEGGGALGGWTRGVVKEGERKWALVGSENEVARHAIERKERRFGPLKISLFQ